jgi:signal transduction histidine kinase
MEYYSISALCNALVSFALAFIVYKRGIDAAANKALVYWCLSVAFWSIGYFFWQLSTSEAEALLWTRMLMIGAVWVPFTFFNFVVLFLRVEERHAMLKKSIASFSVFFTLLLPTRLMVSHIEPALTFEHWPKPGLLYTPFLIMFVGVSAYATILAVSAYRRENSIKRQQIKLVIFGITISVIGGSTNYFLWYDIPIKPYGNILASTYVITAAYAILRYRFLDIRLVVRRAFVFLGTGAFAFVTFYLVYWLQVRLFGTIFGARSYALGIFNSVVFVIAFYYLRIYLERFSNKYFFAGLYNAQQTVVGLAKQLDKITDLDSIIDTLVSTVKESMALDRAGVFFLDREKDKVRYRVAHVIGFSNAVMHDTLIEDGFLTAHLERTREPLVRDELPAIIQRHPERRAEMERLERFMRRTEAALYLPLLSSTGLVGVMILGDKVSRDAYTREDIDLLTTLSYQAGTALQNALLYQQLQSFNDALQTEINRATAELRTANEQLMRLDAAKSEFLSIASHQLLTPLTPIRGYTSMILEGDYGEITPDMRELIREMNVSAVRLVDLVEDLLSISRIESGTVKYGFIKSSVEEIVASLAREAQIKAKEKEVVLTYHAPEKPLPLIYIDVPKIRNVFMNLIDNSLKYAPGTQSDITVTQAGDMIRFTVKDKGMGIDAADMTKLFTKFSRGEDAGKLNTEGTGLGLFVAKQYVEAHHGRIWAESAGKGKGSAFIVELLIKPTPDILESAARFAAEQKKIKADQAAALAPASTTSKKSAHSPAPTMATPTSAPLITLAQRGRDRSRVTDAAADDDITPRARPKTKKKKAS